MRHEAIQEPKRRRARTVPSVVEPHLRRLQAGGLAIDLHNWTDRRITAGATQGAAGGQGHKNGAVWLLDRKTRQYVGAAAITARDGIIRNLRILAC